jgi:hypothetical protein
VYVGDFTPTSMGGRQNCENARIDCATPLDRCQVPRPVRCVPAACVTVCGAAALRRRAVCRPCAAGQFIDGKEVAPTTGKWINVEDPSTGAVLTTVAGGDGADIAAAVAAAQRSFDSGVWSRTDVRTRAVTMNSVAAALATRVPEIADMESAQVRKTALCCAGVAECGCRVAAGVAVLRSAAVLALVSRRPDGPSARCARSLDGCRSGSSTSRL